MKWPKVRKKIPSLSLRRLLPKESSIMVTSQSSTTDLSTVRSNQYISLTTFKRDGTAIATPVWFAEQGGKLYIYTDKEAGKVKRIRNNQQVTLAACSHFGKLKGPMIQAKARILRDATEEKMAHSLIARKYHIMFAAFSGLGKLTSLFNRSTQQGNAYVEIFAAK